MDNMENYINDLVYKTDPNDGTIIAGGYPMTKYLKKENQRRSQMGGSIYGIARFEQLVIPFSIDSHDNGYHEQPILKKVKYHDTIDDELFDKLFDKVGSHRKPKSKTHKSRPTESQPTKTKKMARKTTK
jgi:hypothetical protein